MSYEEFNTMLDRSESNAVYTAQRTRDMLAGSHLALIEAINHNLTLPKPSHRNRPLMDAALRLEAVDG